MNVVAFRNLGSVDIFIEYYLIQYVEITTADLAHCWADVGELVPSGTLSIDLVILNLYLM